LNDGRTILLARQDALRHQKPALGNYGFTPREQQVAERIAHGESIDDVATHLTISRRTAQKHLERIFRKLGVNNLAAACMKLVRV
jgi:DNA-binding NarL/FixJ family response regulator